LVALDEELPVWTHRDGPRWLVDLERAQESTTQQDNLDTLVRRIGDVQAAGVHRDAGGAMELEWCGAFFADGSEEAQWPYSQDADAVIVSICDIEPIAVVLSMVAVPMMRTACA
jgi:hypothetical protein